MSTTIEKAKDAVVRAAVGCIDKSGYAFRIATEQIARTYFINEKAHHRLERAVANLKEARNLARRKRR